jgi:hypothetical protein
MHVLIASSDPRWTEWIRRALVPAVLAFDSKPVFIDAPVGTSAFEQRLQRALDECEGMIAMNPPDGVAEGTAAWLGRAIDSALAMRINVALVRAPNEPLYHKDAPDIIECAQVDSPEALIRTAEVLGSWHRAVKGRFLIGPPDLVQEIKRRSRDSRMRVEYCIQTRRQFTSKWVAAEVKITPAEFEVRTERPSYERRVQLRVIVGESAYESEFTPIDRRVMNLQPTQLFDPREGLRLAEEVGRVG